METYEVIEMTVGNKTDKEKIVFMNTDDLERAYKEIDEGRDIYVSKDGEVTRILHQMISAKIYNGQILLCAKR